MKRKKQGKVFKSDVNMQGPYNWYFSTGMMKASYYSHMTIREFITFLNETCRRLFLDLEIPIGSQIKVNYEGESGPRNFTGTFTYLGHYHIKIQQKRVIKKLDFTHIKDIEIL